MALELVIERPVAGGRMLAREEGKVVLVAGAVPGERVRAAVERETASVTWATTVEVIEASPHRRLPGADPACGGLAYAHIDLEYQRVLKGLVVEDAFRRIARMTLDSPVAVEASPEQGYRLRARLHVRGGRSGFFREGSHDLCDARATRQLLSESFDAIHRALDDPAIRGCGLAAVTVAENIQATDRVLHFEPAEGGRLRLPASVPLPQGVTGLSVMSGAAPVALAGTILVRDSAADVCAGLEGMPRDTTWTRQPTSFFQGNRFLLPALVREVIAQGTAGPTLDLYSGVGLFAVGLAAMGSSVVAVEGEPGAAADLERNAAPLGGRIRAVHAPVEQAAGAFSPGAFDAIVLDPPRTGASARALAALIALRAARVVYVSCDPPTLARDTTALVAGGYRLRSLRAFDLFPNTAHVESVAVFDRG